MISLFRLHWQFIRHPTAAIEEHIAGWPLGVGLVLFILNFYCTFAINAKMLRITSDMLAGFWGLPGVGYTNLYLALMTAYSALVTFFIQPHIVRRIAGIPAQRFESNLYRKLIFYSPTAAMTYTALVLLPLQILSATFVLSERLLIPLLIVVILDGIAGLWGIVASINMFIVQWKGMIRLFRVTPGDAFLSVFVVPILFALPFVILYGIGAVTFMERYAR